MIDPMVAMAFAIYSNKGAYALLLGSGISRASGIPTGWEVVLDLIRKVAKLEGDDCEQEPANWFLKKHGSEPDYSKLLEEVAKTPAERQQLLRSYFEPNADERRDGLKLPTAAHKAIAQLAARGYVRVIVTTNFDALTEIAMEEIGVTPTVISTPDQLLGAPPLVHAGVTVIKLHGDYRDARIKNTDSELAAYDKAVNKLLARIFDEYGLIISGWSGEWDLALRSAIERCPNKRFTTFWTTRSPLGEKAAALAARRSAVVVSSKDANELFLALSEKVQALEEINAPHPLSSKLAAATVKRYIVEPKDRIRLRDLMHLETEKLYAEMNDGSRFGGQTHQQDHALELLERVNRYGALTETLLSIFVTGCYWAAGNQSKLWVSALQRIARQGQEGGGLEYLLKLRRFPALLLVYAGGIAAIASENYSTFAEIVTGPKIKGDDGKNVPFCSVVYAIAVMDQKIGHMLPGLDRHHTPVSDYLFAKLRDPLREFLPEDDKYQEAFDRFEYLYGVIHADLNRWGYEDGWWGPVGCFGWRGRRLSGERLIATAIDAEIENLGGEWPPLKAGLFGGVLDRAKTTKAKFDAFLKHLRFF